MSREIKADRGTEISCKGWRQEAILRMLQNNLENAEKPAELIVYGGTGKAARNRESYEKIVESLKGLEDDETLLVQSGKPVGIFRTFNNSPRVLIANSNLVPAWSNWEVFNALEKEGLMMYGQMTAGSWCYIGTQGIIQGTYETFAACARKHFGASLSLKCVPFFSLYLILFSLSVLSFGCGEGRRRSRARGHSSSRHYTAGPFGR